MSFTLNSVQNDGYTYTNIISSNNEGSVLAFYTKNYAHSSEEIWQRRIEDGQISVDGEIIRDCSFLLRKKQKLCYHRPGWLEPAVALSHSPVQIIFEDDAVVIFNKPSGIQVLPANDFLENTLLFCARHYYERQNREDVADLLSPVHRLGRGTSGAILFTKTLESSRILSAAMANREFTKKYLALVEGIIESEQDITIEQPIGPIPYSAISTTGTIYAASDSGKYAKSVCRVLRRNEHENTSLVEVEISTGRPHQIRIHMAYIGHPLVGDPLYSIGGLPTKKISDEDGERDAIPGDCGYFLHSWKLGYPCPTNIEDTCLIVCPPPPELLPIND